MITAPSDRWDAAIDAARGVDEVVARSRLLGADRAIANEGGGNTSMKGEVVDHAGRRTRVLWVKGSGTDLATITRSGFPALRLEDIDPLLERDHMDDAEMVDYLVRCGLSPDQPRPSIETLLHAFIPATHVDHTHPDAIIALTSCPPGRELAREAFGDEAVWIDYLRPGFDLAKQIALALADQPAARFVLMAKHGLVTWGDDGRTSYAVTLEACARAAEVLAVAGSHGRPEQGSPSTAVLGGQAVAPVGEHDADRLLAAALPALRGSLLAGSSPTVLLLDRSPAAVEFASSARGLELSQVGAACPDHLVTTKARPLVADWRPGGGDDAERLAGALHQGANSYAEGYRRFYDDHLTDESRPFAMDPPGPRVTVIPGLGIVTAGGDASRARLSRDTYHRAIEVIAAADACGGFSSLTEEEAFAVEYWPLERYKLAQRPARKELGGRVAFVTGAASGIGRAVARHLAALDAHVVVADRNADGAADVAGEIVATHGEGRAIDVGFDVTEEDAVADAFRRTVLAYGGLDVLVSSAGIASSAPIEETTVADWDRVFDVLGKGYFLVAREAFRVLRRQGSGGSVVFVASKNALVAGRNAAAYSAAKAAELHLARCLAEEGGPDGIRVNVVNPDAVIADSAIWSSSWKAERAAAYGISEDELADHYRRRTTLGVTISAEDIAEAVAFLAGDRSAKSTGNILNVDGGVAAAYTR
jgi:rhamnulose-1-phosphate aldolase/alcohol dehydrogenase